MWITKHNVKSFFFLHRMDGEKKILLKKLNASFFLNYCATELVVQSVKQSDSQYQTVCQAFLPIIGLPLLWRQGFNIINDKIIWYANISHLFTLLEQCNLYYHY